MKILVTGIKGQLGYDVMKELAKRKIEAVGADIEEFDITNYTQTQKFIEDNLPDAVIHCSAYTAVDKAEDNIDLAKRVNGDGTGNIAKVCKKNNIKMIYISTDYVFNGEGDNFFETDDPAAPLGVYGETKLMGENAVKAETDKYFIVRISWVFGKNGNNFVKTMLRLSETKNEINVVCDQIGSPTYTADLAVLLCDMAATEKYGTYHATNEGICSWAEFTEEIFRQAGRKTIVNHITSDQYPSKAKRPKNSRLSKKSLDEAGFKRLPHWKDALSRFLDEIK